MADLSLTPIELIDRIAALVPPPRKHKLRYFGALAPNSPLSEIVIAMALRHSGATKGARLVDQAGTTMGSIVESVERVASIIGEIMNATREQTSGIGEINMAVTQMDQATQQNAALVEGAAAASESMQEQAVQLAQVVSVFHLGTEAANVGVLNVGVLLDSRSERLAVPASKSRTLSVASANG